MRWHPSPPSSWTRYVDSSWGSMYWVHPPFHIFSVYSTIIFPCRVDMTLLPRWVLQNPSQPAILIYSLFWSLFSSPAILIYSLFWSLFSSPALLICSLFWSLFYSPAILICSLLRSLFSSPSILLLASVLLEWISSHEDGTSNVESGSPLS